ncbi:MAG: PDZ domain-containing protein [Acidobacteria bacterium]|nr:PDZ domain-containing protein [Acidobacteriota bacterium]
MQLAGMPRPSREVRLLVATIVVSVAVLLVLSRFRFPASSAESRDSSATQPLARLAARAAFDDLSLTVRELQTRVAGSLVVVEIAPNLAADRPAASRTRRFAAALRVRDDAAVVMSGEGMSVEAVAGVQGPVAVLASDPVRGITVVRVPPAPAPVMQVRESGQPVPAPDYMVVVEASAGGAGLRPVFVSRSDTVSDPRWDSPLLAIGRGVGADAGAPVFALDGRLAGILTPGDDVPLLVPAAVLLDRAHQLLRTGSPAAGDVGLVTHDLDARLARAIGVATGAAIVSVDAGGPTAAAFGPGDVVTAINNQPIVDARAFRQRVSRTAPGTTLTMRVRRDGDYVLQAVVVRALPGSSATTGAASDSSGLPLGLTMRAAPRVGSTVVSVQPDSAAARGGLVAGDRIVAIGRTPAPQPRDVTAAFAALAPRAALVLSVEHEARTRLVAVVR